MSTMTWLVRSCSSACWLPLDDHELSSSHVAVKNMAFDKKNEKNFNNNLSRASKKCHSKRQLNNPIIKDKDVVIPNKFDHSSWSLSVDEDYIVFCFGKDVAQRDKGVKSEALIKGLNKYSRPVNRKLKYGDEDEEQVSDLNIHEKRSNANQHHNDRVTPYNPDFSFHEEERVMVHTSTQQHRDSMRRACQVEGIEGSAESINSDQSEGSRNSFAFPVLSWEWIGSPVQMPKSEGLQLRKHKARANEFFCPDITHLANSTLVMSI
ncbi:Protein BREAKING OF ASYMMETRY IN THE STOMATAL LINEAGE, partial [Mucuna pruriens]